MKSNILDALENRLSVNSYLWPKNIDPYEFIEAILKAGIKNIGLHTDFIEVFGVNKLKQELALNRINVTSINSVGYFTDPYYFKQNEKVCYQRRKGPSKNSPTEKLIKVKENKAPFRKSFNG